jgi:hypothetical protein
VPVASSVPSAVSVSPAAAAVSSVVVVVSVSVSVSRVAPRRRPVPVPRPVAPHLLLTYPPPTLALALTPPRRSPCLSSRGAPRAWSRPRASCRSAPPSSAGSASRTRSGASSRRAISARSSLQGTRSTRLEPGGGWGEGSVRGRRRDADGRDEPYEFIHSTRFDEIRRRRAGTRRRRRRRRAGRDAHLVALLAFLDEHEAGAAGRRGRPSDDDDGSIAPRARGEAGPTTWSRACLHSIPVTVPVSRGRFRANGSRPIRGSLHRFFPSTPVFRFFPRVRELKTKRKKRTRFPCP